MISVVTDLERQATNLEAEIETEKKVAQQSPEEAGIIYGPYAAHSILRRQQFAAAIAEMEEKLEVAQDEMREEYRDLKGFEISQENRDKQEALENSRAEQNVLDEIGMETYRRKGEEVGSG